MLLLEELISSKIYMKSFSLRISEKQQTKTFTIGNGYGYCKGNGVMDFI